MDGSGQSLDSDGNRVNGGRFNADGLNLNNNWDDNVNDNIGVASSRQSICHPRSSHSRWESSLPFFRRLDPAAQHSADLIHGGF